MEEDVEEEVLCMYQPPSPVICPSMGPHTPSGLNTLMGMYTALCCSCAYFRQLFPT